MNYCDMWVTMHYWFLTAVINRICEAKLMNVSTMNGKLHTTYRHLLGGKNGSKTYFPSFQTHWDWLQTELPDCWAVIWLEKRPGRESVTLMWNVLGDCDRRDFLEGSQRLEEDMGAWRQDTAKGEPCSWLTLLLVLIYLTCSKARWF